MKFRLFLLTLLMSSSVFAEPLRSLTVKGEGESEIPPNFVRVTATIEAEDKEPGRVKADIDERMNKVVNAIASFDIKSRDITFGGADLSQTYKYDKNDNQNPTGYRVTRTLEVRLRDLDAYEQLVQALVAAGADEVGDPESDVDDKNALKLLALKQAAANAQVNAAAIAQSLGVTLGSPLEVGEDRLLPRLSFEQARAEDSRKVEEIVVTAERRGISRPLLFIPKNIRTTATVWVRFEVLRSAQ